MKINNVDMNYKSLEVKTVNFSSGTDFKLTISTVHKEDRRICIKRLTRLQEDTEVLVAECYINEIDLNGHEFSSFNPENYIHRELFNAGYLDKADFRNYESKEN
nr:MAG TPA: hypothetical protein [Caudoviricetes sp.]